MTDGEPTQEPQNRIFEVIMAAKRACLNSQYGGKAVAFMFAQVSRTQVKLNHIRSQAIRNP